MKRHSYRFTILIIALGTIAIGIAYLLTHPRPSQPDPLPQPTLTPSPLPTFTPRPTSTPIVPPSQSQIPGDKFYFYGDWEKAITAYNETLETAQSTENRHRALLGLGKTYYQQGEFSQALDALRNLISSSPSQSHLSQAHFFLAETYARLGRNIEAAEAYAAYLAVKPGIIDAFVQEKRGDALYAAEQYVPAIEAYSAAISAPSLKDGSLLKIKIGRSYQALEDYDSALVIFKEVYNQTSNDYTKASADYLIGQTYDELDQEDQAQAAYLDAVIKYPLSYDAYLALVELVERGYPVNELDRGLVDYYAGQYTLAIEAFNRYLEDPEAEDPGLAYYYKGFAYYKIGATQYQSGEYQAAVNTYQNALASWSLLIDNHPDHAYWDEAWEFTAYTQWAYLNQYPEAVQTLLEFVDINPYHGRAPEFLFDAASVSEREGKLEQAASLWKRVYNEYPTSSYANRALFLEGIMYARMNATSEALSTFNLYQQASQNIEEEAQAYFWIGKIHQTLGNNEAAQSAWSRAANVDPTGYYSERARDLLQGREPFQPPQDYDFGYDIEKEKREAEEWMRAAFPIPQETNLSSLGALADDPRLIRGTELWNLNQYDEARKEFEILRKEVDFDPASSYRLANYFLEIGLYRSAIYAARQVLNSADMSDAETMNAPMYFNRIRFGNYYQELVFPASQAYNLHPLLLFSVIRQESLFEGFVRSSAGARGLMQIIPSTGRDIAEKAGWPPNYTEDDLYRPKVSITYGASYLSYQRNYFDGNIYAALAAYNGGPGNASKWLDAAGEDYDLFLESIRFEETREYIKSIAEIFSIYRRLYQRTP
ncbi:MAG: tetratricopeptide repeat protein [Anaerolineales bacterium]